MLLQDARRPRRPQAAARSLREEQELLELREDALGVQRIQGHGATEGQRVGMRLEFEAAGELHEAIDPQRVLGEGRSHVAQDAALEVVAAAEKVEQLAAQHIHEHRVDGEVPARAGLGWLDARVQIHGEAAVAAARQVLAPGQAEVDHALGLSRRGELEHAEGSANGVHLAPPRQDGLELAEGKPVDLHVDIEARPPPQAVAHVAAHVVGPSAGGGDLPGDVLNECLHI